MPPEQIRQLIRDSVQAELANGTFERNWSSLQFRFPTRHPMPAATPFARWHHRALGSLRGSCGPSLSTYCTCFLSSNDTLSVHSFIPSLCLADSASVVRNGESCFSANIRKSGLASIMCCITTSFACSENGLSAMGRNASRNSQYAGHRVVGDQCPSPWSRRLPAPQHESHGPSREPPRLRPARPSFSILMSPIPDRHELIEVNCTPDEYSGYLKGAGWSVGGVR